MVSAPNYCSARTHSSVRFEHTPPLADCNAIQYSALNTNINSWKYQQQQTHQVPSYRDYYHHSRTNTNLSNSLDSVHSSNSQQMPLPSPQWYQQQSMPFIPSDAECPPYHNQSNQSTQQPFGYCNNFSAYPQQPQNYHIRASSEHTVSSFYIPGSYDGQTSASICFTAATQKFQEQNSVHSDIHNSQRSNLCRRAPSGPCYNRIVIEGNIPFTHRRSSTRNSYNCGDSDEFETLSPMNAANISDSSLNASQKTSASASSANSDDSGLLEHGIDDEIRNIKVTGLPRDCTSYELRALFEFYFGTVVSCVVMMNKTGSCRGYGSVVMQCRDHAEVAVRQLQKGVISIRDQRIGAHLSRKQHEVESAIIFIGNIPEALTDVMLNKVLSRIGGPIVQIKVNPGREFRSATVELTSKQAAVEAVQLLHGAYHVTTGEAHINLPVPLYAKFTRAFDSSNSSFRSGSDTRSDPKSAVPNVSREVPGALPRQQSSAMTTDGAIAASVPPPPGLVSGLWSDEVEQDEAVTKLLVRVRELSRMKLPLKARTVKKYFHKFLECSETPQSVRDDFYALARHHQLELYKALCV